MPLAILALALTPVVLQDPHAHKDTLSCRKCSGPYQKALASVVARFPKAGFPEKIIAGFLFLADGRHPNELQQVVQVASRAKASANSYNGNWYLGMAGLFLSEHYRLQPSPEVKQALLDLVETAQKTQEPTGGWNHHLGFGKKYCADDLSIVTSMLFTTLLNMRESGIDVPKPLVERTGENLAKLLRPTGLDYGTRDSWGEVSGSRIGMASIGLHAAGLTSNPIYTTALKALPERLKRLDKGHGTGCIHLLSVTLACHRLGIYSKLTDEWLDKLIAKQAADGSFLLGDDGAGGGEKQLIGNDIGSTAAFALFLLLQDGERLNPRIKAKAAGKGGASPYSRR
jgi:hypothetical protein